jgi:hypothetical protein
MKTWNDIKVGLPIYIMVVSDSLGIMSYYESMCVSVDQGRSYCIFTYDGVGMKYKPSDSFGNEFGILGGDFENTKHQIVVRSLDANFIYYSDKAALLTDLATYLDVETKKMSVVNDKRVKCLELIESLD